MVQEWFAAIGSDGTRPVVWGLGHSRGEAMADAVLQADSSGVDPEVSEIVQVTDAQANMVLAGTVAATELEIGR